MLGSNHRGMRGEAAREEMRRDSRREVRDGEKCEIRGKRWLR